MDCALAGTRVDLSTVFGLLAGAALILSAIVLGGRPSLYLDFPSFLIVFGGTLGVTFIKNPLDRVFSTLSVVRKAFTNRLTQPEELAEQIVQLSRKARRESLLALNRVPIGDPFLARSVKLAVDGMEPAEIKTLLEAEIQTLAQRHKQGQELLEGMAASAPAFGMIGTLIGLVQMLANMNEPHSIGPAMAVALLTTLYGALLAYLVCLPLAEKLRNRSRQEVNARMMVLQGIVAIAHGEHPMSIGEKLAPYVEPRARRESRRDVA